MFFLFFYFFNLFYYYYVKAKARRWIGIDEEVWMVFVCLFTTGGPLFSCLGPPSPAAQRHIPDREGRHAVLGSHRAGPSEITINVHRLRNKQADKHHQKTQRLVKASE